MMVFFRNNRRPRISEASRQALATTRIRPDQPIQQSQQRREKMIVPPASNKALASLLHMRLRAMLPENGSICSVCTEAYEEGAVVTTLPCGHMFHSECVVPWLRRRCTCPTCRFELPTNDPEFEEGRAERMKERAIVQLGCDSVPENSRWVQDIRDLDIDSFDCIVSRSDLVKNKTFDSSFGTLPSNTSSESNSDQDLIVLPSSLSWYPL